MTRKTEGWQTRLAAYLHEVGREGFAYGAHDCALFAAGAVQAMTGIDLAADWRGRYTSLRGGLRVLRAAGYADHVALAAAHFPTVDRPRPGDLAVMQTLEGPALGIVQGALVYLRGPDRIGLLPVSDASHFFGV